MVCVVVAWLALAAVRLTAPSDLLDNDQVRPAMYALDAIRNGHWIIQTDPTGDIASKPPVYTWFVAATAKITGNVDEWSLYLPTAFAMLGMALMVLFAPARRFGMGAGLLGAGMILFSPFGAKHLALARTDGVFALMVCAAALLAFRAWDGQRRWGWTWCCLACAAATLTKGPLGVALASGGLLVAVWERRNEAKGRKAGAIADHACGVFLFVAICGGWFLAAYSQVGQPLIDKMIGRELVGHVTSSDSGGLPFVSFYKPPLYFLSRFAPWCIPAVVGLWRVITQPATSIDERRFERFLACWFLAGLAVFCAAPHQRADLLLPLIPAAAMLAGRELAHWAAAWRRVRVVPMFAGIAMIGTAAVAIDRHVVRREDAAIQVTEAWRELARRIEAIPGEQPRLVDVEGPMALQMFLQIHQRRATMEEAIKIARSGEAALFVHRGDDERLLGSVLETMEDPLRHDGAAVMISTNNPTTVLPPSRVERKGAETVTSRGPEDD